ncbi:MAG: 3-phosphoshikimate 1-carboxyvinyltransferase [Verrucomicrobia bacterium]|nr:3-phosphoshikimate 1-carboxyvinyltransferase [Verrucomicrobiota bacterium]
MPLPDLLPIQPFTRPARGEVTLPGSKSLTNRALLLAALAGDRPITLTGALFSEDTHLMAEALRQLRFTVIADEPAHTLRVSYSPETFTAESAELFVGLAGTAARFLTALCAALPGGVYLIDGVPQMRKRPMKPLIDALRTLGAEIHCTGVEGFFPLKIHARGLRGGPVSIDASESSQLLSALLMVSPLAREPIELTLTGHVRRPFVLMTARLMEIFGQPPLDVGAENRFTLPVGSPYAVVNQTYAIEPDATAASYFAALPLVTGGQLSFARDHPRRGVTQNFAEFSDTFLTLAAIAPLLDGPTTITGIAHSRKQETDRVAGMVAELRKLGQDVHEHEDQDGLTITPGPLRSGVEIETYGDHRFAMSFGILGCHDLHGDGRPWLSIRNPACCAKTFPHFFELLESLRQNSLAP